MNLSSINIETHIFNTFFELNLCNSTQELKSGSRDSFEDINSDIS